MNNCCAICILHRSMVERCRPCPEYEIIPSEEESGSQTFYCRVTADKIVAVGVASTNKKAKLEAAECALHLLRFTDIYMAIKELIGPTFRSETVCSLGSIMRGRNLTKEDLWKDIINRDEPNLYKLLTKLDLTYSIKVKRNNEKKIVFISINTQPEISVTLIAETIEEARQKIVYKCFEFLEILTK